MENKTYSHKFKIVKSTQKYVDSLLSQEQAICAGIYDDTVMRRYTSFCIKQLLYSQND